MGTVQSTTMARRVTIGVSDARPKDPGIHRPMRIDLIITELNLGGAERQLTQLAIGMQNAGHRVRVISIGSLPDSEPDNTLVIALARADVPIVCLDCDRVWRMPWAISRLRQTIAKDRPDVVQSFLFHANVLASAALRRERSLILVGGIRVAQNRRWRLKCEALALSKMHATVCVSDSVAEFARMHLGQAGQQTVTIPNGVDGKRFENVAPADWSKWGVSIDPKEPTAGVILYVGRFHEQKGTDWLMQLAPEMLARNPASALVLIGDGPLRPQLEQLFAKLPEGKAVVVPRQSDIASFLIASRLLLLTSRYEGMPNTVMEAMAAGVPVVSTDVHGVKQLLGPTSESLTMQFGDTQSLLQRVSTLMNDLRLRSQVVDTNRVRAREAFSVTHSVQQYLNLYTKLRQVCRGI